MSLNLKQLFFAGIAALAVLCFTPAESKATNAGVAGTWDWTNGAAWSAGVPSTGVSTEVGWNGANVNGVILNVTTAATMGHMSTHADSVINVDASASLTGSSNFNMADDSVINIYGDVANCCQVLHSGAEVNIFNGGEWTTSSSGAYRLGQGDGSNTVLNLHPGSLFSFNGTDANTAENNPTGSAVANQTGGLAKFLNANFQINAGGGGGATSSTTWNLSGGELAIGGTLTQFAGTAASGIYLSDTGKLYVSGDQSGDLTHGGTVFGAVSATFGNYVLSDSTALTGYTLFEGAPVPEPSSFALAAFGLAGLGWFGIRRRR